MKSLVFNIICLLFISTVTYGSTNSKKKEFEKLIEKEFPITADGTTDITNKYGNVNISEWNNNSVSIVVSITAKTSTQEKANQIFDRINIDFSNTNNYVSAATEIESQSSWFRSWNSNSDFQINYDVKMPSTNHLKVSNKYGNTNLPDLKNGLDIYMGYGNVNFRNVQGETKMKLSYGNCDFGSIDDLDLELKYSNLSGDATGDANINSKYSKIELKESTNIRCVSGYDKYKIGKVGEFSNDGKYDGISIEYANSVLIESKYTNIEIENLEDDAEITQKFGEVKIDHISCQSGLLDISAEYTEIRIGMDGCNNYDIEYHGKYTGFRKPDGSNNNVQEDGQSTSFKDKKGSGDYKMRFSLRYGSLKFR